jgi:flagellar biosynthesis/type III secretory pathway protein FliH
MYENPIEMIQRTINEKMKQEEDRYVYEIEQQVGFHIDKQELIRALNYDRDQYNQGYIDGKAVGYELGYQQALQEMGVINDNDTTIQRTEMS